jgi:hypothetical protein
MRESLYSLCDWLKANSKLLTAIGNWTGFSPTGVTLWIELAAERRDRGQLWLMDQANQCRLGRLPVQLDGAVVGGNYGVTEIRLTGPGTDYAASDYGSAGIVLLDNGRANLAIHGGDRRATARHWTGGIRLQAADMRSLVIALEAIETPVTCQIVEYRESRSTWDNDRDWDWQDDGYNNNAYNSNTYIETNHESFDGTMPDQWEEPSTIELPAESIGSEPLPAEPVNWIDDGYC